MHTHGGRRTEKVETHLLLLLLWLRLRSLGGRSSSSSLTTTAAAAAAATAAAARSRSTTNCREHVANVLALAELSKQRGPVGLDLNVCSLQDLRDVVA